LKWILEREGDMSERNTSPFGTKLKQLREAAGLTQGELANQAGMHKFGIAKLEQGTREPSWETVQALAKALRVDCTAFATNGVETNVSPRGRPRKDAAPGKPVKAKKGGRK
jgi:transcriptional regulator with XRE-family HTH domain